MSRLKPCLANQVPGIASFIGGKLRGKLRALGRQSMNDAEIFYKAISVLVDRELKVKAMTSRAIADALMLALSKLIETAPDAAQQKELRVRVCEHLERIAKGDRALH